MSRRREGTAGVRVRESAVPVLSVCWWEGCETLTYRRAQVELTPPGSKALVAMEVMICDAHERIAMRTGRINLKMRYSPNQKAPTQNERPVAF